MGDVIEILGDALDDVIEVAGVDINDISSDLICNINSFADNSDAVVIVDDALDVADNEDDETLISLLTPDVFEGTER